MSPSLVLGICVRTQSNWPGNLRGRLAPSARHVREDSYRSPTLRRWTAGPDARHPRREPTALLGAALLLAGILLTAWRLRIDFTPHHAALPARRPAIVHPQPPSPLPTPMAALPPTLPLTGGPSLDASLVDAILAAYKSPLRGEGARIVALSARYHIDDAVALAFFVMESRAGTRGESVLTHSAGNLRPMPDAPALDGYRSYATWQEGTDEWFKVMRSLYLGTLKLSTVEDVVPVYAPPWDNNDPGTMIAGIRQLVSCWRGAPANCPDDPPGVPALVARAWGMAPQARAPAVLGPQLPRPTSRGHS